MSAIAGGIIGAIAGGLVGHGIGYDAGVKVGYNQGYNQAKWEMQQEMASMKAEFTDQIRQLRAEMNQMARNDSNKEERLTRMEELMGRILTILQAEVRV